MMSAPDKGLGAEQLLGHAPQRNLFQTAIAKGRLASSFLFVGPSGIGKRQFAQLLAQSLLCDKSEPSQLEPCRKCVTCRQVEAGTHPDILTVAKPENRNTIPLELLIGEGEMRMKEGLCHDLFVRPISGKRRIAIIDDADSLSEEGANSLLKTLEEPPHRAVIVLISTSIQRQLPTILSRCQIIRFDPLGTEEVKELLRRSGEFDENIDLEEAARLSGGSIDSARIWLEGEAKSFRDHWLELLAQPKLTPQERMQVAQAFVDSAGKERRDRIPRLRLAIQLTVDFYRAVMKRQLGQNAETDSVTERFVAQASQCTQFGVTTCVALMERTLLAQQHLASNAHLPTLIDSWLMDLAALSNGQSLHREHLFSAYDGLNPAYF